MSSSHTSIKAILLLPLLLAAGSAHPAFASRDIVATHVASGIGSAAAPQVVIGSVRTGANGSGKLHSEIPVRKQATVGQWTLIGPQPLIHPDFDGMRPISGLVYAIAVDPRNSSVVYLGTDGGGVWKTTDGGQT